MLTPLAPSPPAGGLRISDPVVIRVLQEVSGLARSRVEAALSRGRGSRGAGGVSVGVVRRPPLLPTRDHPPPPLPPAPSRAPPGRAPPPHQVGGNLLYTALPLYLPYISPISPLHPLHLPYISQVGGNLFYTAQPLGVKDGVDLGSTGEVLSPLHLPYISPISPLHHAYVSQYLPMSPTAGAARRASLYLPSSPHISPYLPTQELPDERIDELLGLTRKRREI